MRFSEEGPSCGLAYQIDIEDAANWPQDAELTLSYTCSMIRQCFDRNWSPAEVHFMHEPSPRPDLLEQIFRAPVRFKQKFNRILIRPEELDLAYRIEDPELISVLNRHIADLILETSEKKSSYSERVRAVVARKIGRNPCTVESVACELGTTARSLQRYLMQEGTSWREILKQCRQKMIETHLAEKNMTMGELASTLGYADGTVLWRAFKQWTGQPPSRELKSLSSHKERGKEGNSSLN